MSEMSIGIFLNPDEDCVRLQFDDVGDEFTQHLLAQYLHPRLLAIKQRVPRPLEIKVHITKGKELLVEFEPVGSWSQRQQFEKFLYKWLPKAMQDYSPKTVSQTH